MQPIQEKMRIYGSQGPWFDAVMDVGAVAGSNGQPVVKTDVVVFKSAITIPFFQFYKEGQVFTYEIISGARGDVYFVSETSEVYAFSSHPHLL